jgi:beta-galactosidase
MQLRILLVLGCCAWTSAGWSRETVSFNEGWRFARFGAQPDGTQLEEPQGLETDDFDDSGWRTLDVPHDWGIEGPFRDDLPNQTGKLPWAGIGWYRKTFLSEESDRGKRVFLDFDGAMSGTSVWLNGHSIGQWPYGYSSFRLELTDQLKPGQKNTIAVRLDNQADSSRWYPGGGIYRNVWLVKTDPVHVAHWGTFVTTPDVSPRRATVEISTQIEGASEGIQVRHEIFTADEASSKVGEQITQPGTACRIVIASPRLWDLKTPSLYRAETTVLKDGTAVDEYTTVFGIRTIEYTADQGFLLNGTPVRMNGVCQHHDLGPLGTAINPRALERQIEILQAMGCNAIRTSHNPPAPELLALCDRMGMLVQVEAFDCWKTGKAPNDYARHFPEWHEKDLGAMVRRDRNHPCVVMWSTGNEIREQGNEPGHRISQMLTEIVKRYDTTRPVTAGCNNPQAGTNGFQKTVDLFGYNYKPHLYEAFRKANPTQPLYGSETASTISSRGEYFFPVSDDKAKGAGGYFQVSSYDLSAPQLGQPPGYRVRGAGSIPLAIRGVRLDRFRLSRRANSVQQGQDQPAELFRSGTARADEGGTSETGQQHSAAQLLFRHCRPLRFSQRPVLHLPGPLASGVADGAHPATLELARARRPGHTGTRLHLGRGSGVVPEREIARSQEEGTLRIPATLG